MHRSIALAAALIALSLAPSFAQDEPKPEAPAPDIAKLRMLFQQGDQAFRDGKFEDSAKKFAEFLEILPAGELFNEPRSHAHYYLACVHARSGEAGKAVTELDKSMENGFVDFDKIEADTDLESIRGDVRYKAAMEKYRKLEEAKLQAFDFALTTLDGEAISKKKYLGKVLIVDVWGTWCPPCRMEVPHFIELQKKYKEKGLQIVGLNSERARDDEAATKLVKKYIADNGVNYPCALVKQEVLETIPNFRAFPTTLFIGRDGRVRRIAVGYHDLDKLEGFIAPLLAEKAPESAGEAGEAGGEKPAAEEKKATGG